MGKKKPDLPPFKVDELLEAARNTPAIAYHAYYIAETDKVCGFGMGEATSPQSIAFRSALKLFRERFIRTDRDGNNTNHRIDSVSVFPDGSDAAKPIVRVTLYNFFDHGSFVRDVPPEELVQEAVE